MPKSDHLFLYAVIAICCAIEIALTLSDHGSLLPRYARRLVYDYGAFWPGLLGNWKPNYASQPFAMFLTYSFLHSGIVHLGVNMFTLWSLSRAVLARTSQRVLVLVYTGAILGGAAGFALLAPGLRPMVGASGALFGLFGALLAWEYMDSRTDRESLKHIAWVLLVLAALNLLLWWAMNGQLAWQAHLGGFLAGCVSAALIGHKPRKDG